MNEETVGWCVRVEEAVVVKGKRCLRKKEPICEGCVFNPKTWKKGVT